MEKLKLSVNQLAMCKNETSKKLTSMLRACRFTFQNPETFAQTAVYITRIDSAKYRVKVFSGGKLLKKIRRYSKGFY